MKAGALRRTVGTRLPLAVLALVLAACGSDGERKTAPVGQEGRSFSITSTPNKQDWNQCENGKSLTSSCTWVTGNLNAQQNTYPEGSVVPHILRISTISGTDPIAVRMTYGFKKGGKSTFDYLAPYNFTMVNANPCNDSGFQAFCTSGVLKPIDKVSAPIAAPSNLAPADQAGYNASVAVFGASNITISGIGMDALSVGAPVLDNPTGQDVEATVVVTFTPKPGTTEALLLIGSHVARGKDWPNGGASTVPGSPYHLGLVDVNGISAGSMDLQMASDAVVPDTKLTLVKNLINDDGGTATLASFPLTATGTSTGATASITGVSGTTAVTGALVNPGTYALSEPTVAGYSASQWVCTGTGGTQSGANITLVAGADVTCTITNDDNKGSLQIIKRVINDNGGTATVANFGLATTATATLTFDGGVADGANTTKYSSQVIPVSAGSYTLRENDIAGYNEGTWSCTGATPSNTSIAAGAVTVPFAGTVVCTITNDDAQGSLTLVKRVINDNGGTLTVSAFNVRTSAPGTYTFGAGVVDGTALKYTSTTVSVNAGTYDLKEDDVAGYAEGTWSCTGGTINNSGFATGSVTIGASANAVCTITNNDLPGSLQLVKRVVNDNGGTATVANFGLGTNAGSLTFDGGVADGANTTKYSSNVLSVNAGSYTFSELNVAGYAEGTWSCTGANATGTAFNAGSVTVPLDTKVVCTITNNDDSGSLTLVKRVINDNGGSATVSAFNLATNAPGTLSFGAGVADGANTLKYTSNALTVNAGTYSLSESDVAGYAEGTWSCTGGTINNAGFATGSVTVPAAASVVCTITNDDLAGSLQLVKRVVNDNGGTATVANFGIATNAPGTLTFDGGVADGASTTKYSSNVLTVNAGSYTFSELNVSGYAEGTWSCTGAPATGTAFGSGSVTVPLGTAVVCTITNNDDTGSLTLVKRVINDNGGTATVSAFNLATNAPGTLSFGSGVADGANTLKYTSNTLTVNAGTYSLSESDVAGYTEGKWSCTGGTVNADAFGAGSVTVPAATSVVCTITNDDIAPTLQIVKRVVNDNGGTLTVSSFGVNTTAGSLTFGAGVADGANTLKYSSQVLTVKANTAYTLRESDVAGYTEGTWSCTGATPSPTAYNTGSVSLALAATVVCTITNDDQPGTIIIEKTVKGINTTFQFTTTGPGFAGTKSITTVNGIGSSTTTNLVPGVYSVTEVVKADYTLTDLACTETGGTTNTSSNVATGVANITLELGETVTCRYVNTGLLTTRTQGFWQTHMSILQVAWFGGTAGGITTTGVADKNVCGKTLDDLDKVLGGFWSSIPKTSTGGFRSDLDKARMQLAQQLIAAIANNSMFGSVPAGSVSLADARAACAGTNIDQIKAAMSAMGAFNESGDSGLFTPGASAQAKAARNAANLLFWDVF